MGWSVASMKGSGAVLSDLATSVTAAAVLLFCLLSRPDLSTTTWDDSSASRGAAGRGPVEPREDPSMFGIGDVRVGSTTQRGHNDSTNAESGRRTTPVAPSERDGTVCGPSRLEGRRSGAQTPPSIAGVAQWQSPSLPSWSCGFDSRHPLSRFCWSAARPCPSSETDSQDCRRRATRVPQRIKIEPGDRGARRSLAGPQRSHRTVPARLGR